MKKIILAFDGTNFSEGAFEFAHKLNHLQPILLTGIFLPQAELANLWSYAYGSGGSIIPLMESGESEIVQQNITRFKKLCSTNGIDHSVHTNFYDFVLPELKKESRFADLLILGSEVFYENMDTPNDYLRDALHDVNCPVLVVPEKFDFPESVILAYNGSDDSIFAIKQFAYLFPELNDRETVLVYMNKNADEIPEKSQMKEFAGRHFKNLSIVTLDIDPKKYFATWVEEKKSAMLVSGSYGRSGISNLFKKSFVKDIIKDHRLPVFIAHK